MEDKSDFVELRILIDAGDCLAERDLASPEEIW